MQSRCAKPGWLHDMEDVIITASGKLERCARCGFRLKVPNGIPDRVYIQYHVRDILRPGDPQFQREWR